MTLPEQNSFTEKSKIFFLPEASVGKRRVPMKYRDFINVGVNHQQKESRRNYLSDEVYNLRSNFFLNKNWESN